MKKRYIFLIILALIAITIGVLAYINRDNITAVIHGLTISTEDLNQKREETDKKATEAVKEYGVESIRPLTEEETEQLSRGDLTEEEAINLILGKTEDSTEKPSDVTGNEENPSSQESNQPQQQSKEDKVKKANAEIAQLVGKMYVLKSQFTSELSGIKKWVIQEYKKLTPEEKKSDSVKMKIGRIAVADASALEKKCDAQVEEILSKITDLLVGSGQSTDLVKQIRKAYEEEKQLTKSYYISKI